MGVVDADSNARASPIEEPSGGPALGTRSRKKSAGAGSRASRDPDLEPIVEHNTAASSDIHTAATAARVVRASASNFASSTTPVAGGGNDITCMELWLRNRSVITHSFSPVSLLKENKALFTADQEPVYEQMLVHNAVYEEVMAFCYPGEWWKRNKDLPINISPRRREVLDELYDTKSPNWQRMTLDVGRVGICIDLSVNPADAWLVACLDSSLEKIVSDIVDSRVRKQQEAQIGPLGETAWRTSWDSIATEIASNLGAADHQGVMTWHTLERTLRLPCIDESIKFTPEHDIPRQTRQTIAYSEGDLLDSEWKLALANLALAAAENNPRAYADASQWRNAAQEAWKAVYPLAAAWDEHRLQKTRAGVQRLDPMTAKCDGLGVIRVSSFYEGTNKAWIDKFSLISTRPFRQRQGLMTEVDLMTARVVDGQPKSAARTDPLYSAVFRTAAHLSPTSNDLEPSATHSPPDHTHHDPLPTPSRHPSAVSTMDDIIAGLQNTGLGPSDAEGAEFPEAPDALDDTEGTGGAEEAGDEVEGQEDAEDAEDEAIPDKDPYALLLPLLVHEYKRRGLDSGAHSAANQARLDLAAMVKFLGKLTIFGLSVYAVVTEGPVGVVLFAWGEEVKVKVEVEGSSKVISQTRVHIVDRNVRGFDISTTEGAINYATFIAKVKRFQAKRLFDIIKNENIKQKVYEMYTSADKESMTWNMRQSEPKRQRKAASKAASDN
ncbi:hypothetical protein FA95DRAFT_1073160 [Auriscalpium vulgare]|uniref:Uncharacterized protein n=1 Tax=Auriscalpium vulgare TaxID=40419 RepID=A0ACB8RW09_9AGAM|nr:hypothetical protein FA95DRAFT_1073160 [Auriscalpium vulgare]